MKSKNILGGYLVYSLVLFAAIAMAFPSLTESYKWKTPVIFFCCLNFIVHFIFIAVILRQSNKTGKKIVESALVGLCAKFFFLIIACVIYAFVFGFEYKWDVLIFILTYLGFQIPALYQIQNIESKTIA